MNINTTELWNCFDAERRKAWEGHDNAEVGSPEWNECAAKIDVINNICRYVNHMNAAPRSNADKAIAPIWKHGDSLVHSDYADGSAETKVNHWAEWTCPVCGWFVGEQYIPSWTNHKPHNQQKCNFCSRCGQRIDWQTVEKEGEEQN
mgnify:CR=1 FL=1